MNPHQEQIIRNAADLFAQQGIRHVSMDAIAQASGCSRRMVYQLFEGKDALVQAVVAQLTTTATQAYQGVRDERGSAPEEVLRSVPILTAIFCQLNGRVLDDLRRYHYNSWLKITTFREALLLDFIHSNLGRGVADGSYAPQADLPATADARLRSLVAVHESLSAPTDPEAVHRTLLQLAHQYLTRLAVRQECPVLP